MRPALIAASLLLTACGGASDPSEKPRVPEAPPPNTTPILITSRDQVDAAVGKLVTVQGEFCYSKIQLILNVDVDGYDLGPDVKTATATGVLRKSVWTKESLEAEEKRLGGPFAHRGPGTFYHLDDPAARRLAKAKALP